MLPVVPRWKRSQCFIAHGSNELLPSGAIPEFSRKVADVLTEMGAEIFLVSSSLSLSPTLLL